MLGLKKISKHSCACLWKTFKVGVIKACHEMCGKKSRRYWTWWWNEKVKDITATTKGAFKKLCSFQSKENKTQYNHFKNQMRKINARAMRMEAN